MKHALSTFALAICTAQFSANADSWLRVVPMGEFSAVDGRPMGDKTGDGKPVECKAWLLTAVQGQQLVAALKQKQDALVIDYEHQTLKASENGLPAPAAGWMKDFEWRDDGLYALCSWTPNAQSMITNNEYRYISPVFLYDPKTGMVNRLLHAALTNVPALDGLTDVLAKTALSLFSSNSTQTTEDSAMEELLEQLRWTLNMPVGTTADEVKAQLQKLIAQLSDGQGMAAASVDLLALLTGKDQAIAALTQQVQAQVTTTPDPTKFVPIEVVTGLHEQLAVLTQKTQVDEGEALVTAALKDKRIFPAEENWLRGMAKTNLEAAKVMLASRPVIAALSQQQSSVIKPNQHQPAAGLDETALAMCSMFGLTAEQFKAQQTALATGV